MADLEPDVLLSQWRWRGVDDIFETLQSCQTCAMTERATKVGTYLKAPVELLLLFVYYAQTEVDFVCLFEVRLHLHYRRESLLGMI